MKRNIKTIEYTMKVMELTFDRCANAIEACLVILNKKITPIRRAMITKVLAEVIGTIRALTSVYLKDEVKEVD